MALPSNPTALVLPNLALGSSPVPAALGLTPASEALGSIRLARRNEDVVLLSETEEKIAVPPRPE